MSTNIIRKLGYQKYLWFGFLTPALFLFGYWFFEDNIYLTNLAVIIEKDIFRNQFSGYLAIELFVIIIGFVIPLITLSKIKCPNCNIRLVLHYLNGGDKYKKLESPFISTCCPNCGYEP